MFIENEIAYPDPGDVKRLRWMYVAILAGMTAAFWCLRLWIESQLSSVDDPKEIRSVFLFMSIAIAGPALVFALWAFSVCRQVLRTQQWPHPGAKLLRPVPVLRGKKARGKAWALLALGSSLAITCVAASVYLYFGLGARFEELMETRFQESRSANKLLQATCEDARA